MPLADSSRDEAIRVAYGTPDELPPFDSLFQTANPLEVEIGCGKGKFLFLRASEHPEINFLGIDRVGKWMKPGIRKGVRGQLKNLKFVRAHVQPLLEEYIPAKSVDIFHVYFPDPWPKRRHHKRRLVDAAFLARLHGKLGARGRIEIATDYADYFHGIQEAVCQTAGLWREVRDSVNQRLFEASIKTNYELKYEAAGKPLYYLELVK